MSTQTDLSDSDVGLDEVLITSVLPEVNDNQFSCMGKQLFIFAGPCHLARLKLNSGDLIFL